jgi:hypothetical protein
VGLGPTTALKYCERPPTLSITILARLRIGGTSGPSLPLITSLTPTSPQGNIFDHHLQTVGRLMFAEGYNATIHRLQFDWIGKTYTIMGPSAATADQDDVTAGVTTCHSFSLSDFGTAATAMEIGSGNGNGDTSKESRGWWTIDGTNITYRIRRSRQFLELYGEEIRDLPSAARVG